MLRDIFFMEAQTMCNSCNSGCFGGMIFPSFVQNSCCNPCCANSSSSGSVGGTSDSNTGLHLHLPLQPERDGCRDVHGQQQQRYFHHLRVQSLQFLRLQSAIAAIRAAAIAAIRTAAIAAIRAAPEARPRTAENFQRCAAQKGRAFLPGASYDGGKEGTDMISIDEQKERQVWSRVMNTAVSCPKS